MGSVTKIRKCGWCSSKRPLQSCTEDTGNFKTVSQSIPSTISLDFLSTHTSSTKSRPIRISLQGSFGTVSSSGTKSSTFSLPALRKSKARRCTASSRNTLIAFWMFRISKTSNCYSCATLGECSSGMETTRRTATSGPRL